MQPQEIEVWYVLPAIRKALALSLINQFKLTQKEVAGILNIKESTVSQYIKEKRAKEAIFDEEINAELKKSAYNIFKDRKALTFEIQRICSLVRETGILCSLHKKHEKVSESCGACSK